MQKILSRQIHGYRDRTSAIFQNLQVVSAHLLKHEKIELEDLPRFLQDRNETTRRNHAVLRIDPSHQRLAAAYRFRHGADDGLIIDMDPSALQSLFKVPDDMKLQRVVFLNRAVEPGNCRPSGLRDGFAGESCAVTCIGQSYCLVVVSEDAGSYRKIVSVARLTHLGKQCIQLFFNLIALCICDKVIAFKTRSTFFAEMRSDQLRQDADLPVSPLESVSAVIFFQSGQIKIDDRRDLTIRTDLLDAAHRIVKKMGHVLQPRQVVIILCKFSACRWRILSRQRRKHCLDYLIPACFCALIRIRDERKPCPIYRNIFSGSMNHVIFCLVFPLIAEHYIVIMILLRRKAVGILFHPGNVIGMHIPVQIPAKTENGLFAAAVAEKLQISPGNQKRLDLLFHILVHSNRDRNTLQKSPCIS